MPADMHSCVCAVLNLFIWGWRTLVLIVSINSFHIFCWTCVKWWMQDTVTINKHYFSRNMTKPTKWLCAQRRHRSDWADLIRVFAVRMKKAWVLSYLLSTQRRLWSGWLDAQADLRLHWAHIHGFVISQLILGFLLMVDLCAEFEIGDADHFSFNLY